MCPNIVMRPRHSWMRARRLGSPTAQTRSRNLLPLALSSWPSAASAVGRSFFEARSTASGRIRTRPRYDASSAEPATTRFVLPLKRKKISMKQPGLDQRHRDKNGEISRKHVCAARSAEIIQHGVNGYIEISRYRWNDLRGPHTTLLNTPLFQRSRRGRCS